MAGNRRFTTGINPWLAGGTGIVVIIARGSTVMDLSSRRNGPTSSSVPKATPVLSAATFSMSSWRSCLRTQMCQQRAPGIWGPCWLRAPWSASSPFSFQILLPCTWSGLEIGSASPARLVLPKGSCAWAGSPGPWGQPKHSGYWVRPQWGPLQSSWWPSLLAPQFFRWGLHVDVEDRGAQRSLARLLADVPAHRGNLHCSPKVPHATFLHQEVDDAPNIRRYVPSAWEPPFHMYACLSEEKTQHWRIPPGSLPPELV